MRQENSNNEANGNTASDNATTNNTGNAFQYLKALPKNFDRPALKSYMRDKESTIIDHEVAETFTDTFRNSSEAFYIPVSWTMTKSSLINLLGITDHEGHEEVTGVRFYAGLNGDDQLTLVAVSTMEGIGCSDDLTVDDEYPYYDYADPCPTNCSNRGNLKALSAASLKVIVTE